MRRAQVHGDADEPQQWRPFNVYIRYRVTVDTDRRLTPVHAFWVRANGCSPTVSYPVYGGGAPGSTDAAPLRLDRSLQRPHRRRRRPPARRRQGHVALAAALR